MTADVPAWPHRGNNIVLSTKRDQEKQKQQREKLQRLKNNQYVLATNMPFRAHFATKDNIIKAETSTLTMNSFYGNYIHIPYFEKLSSYNGIPDALIIHFFLITHFLFIIARTWKQPRCPSADEWMRKLWYIYTVEYYSAIKKNSFESVLMR